MPLSAKAIIESDILPGKRLSLEKKINYKI